MTDDDKQFVKDAELGNWKETFQTIARLCRIIRELEKPDSQWQREAVELAKQNTSRRAEIENAPIVVGNGPTCHSWTLESWDGRARPAGAARARLVRIEEIK